MELASCGDTPEEKGYGDTNMSKIKLAQSLAAHNGQDKVWNLRHSHNLDLSLTPEARYFQPDGTTNPAALLHRGLTSATVSKSEATNTESTYISANAVENEWGVTATKSVREEEGEGTDLVVKERTRAVEVRSDSTGRGEEVIDFLVKTDVLDDRNARLSRINKFTELAPIIPAGLVEKATSRAAILLEGDEIVVSLRASSIEGLPARYLGHSDSRAYVKLSSGEDGLVLLSLIRNKKNNRLRFHFTLAKARMQFSASENYFSRFFASVSMCCGCLRDGGTSSHSSASLTYSQSMELLTTDLAVPLSEKPFHNVVVDRLSSSSASVIAGSASRSASKSGLKNSLLVTIFAILKIIYDAANAAYDMFKRDLFFIPCVEQVRLSYPCCSRRCLAACCRGACGISEAAMTSQRTVSYDVAETWELGNKESTLQRKVMYSPAAEPEEEQRRDEEWKPFPIWSLLCCLFEYRGAKCGCGQLCYSQGEAKGQAKETFGWAFSEAKDDALIVEFEYTDAEEEIKVMRQITAEAEAKAEEKSVGADVEDQARAAEATDAARLVRLSQAPSDFIRLRLDTTSGNEDIEQSHESARRLVSQIHNDFLGSFGSSGRRAWGPVSLGGPVAPLVAYLAASALIIGLSAGLSNSNNASSNSLSKVKSNNADHYAVGSTLIYSQYPLTGCLGPAGTVTFTYGGVCLQTPKVNGTSTKSFSSFMRSFAWRTAGVYETDFDFVNGDTTCSLDNYFSDSHSDGTVDKRLGETTCSSISSGDFKSSLYSLGNTEPTLYGHHKIVYTDSSCTTPSTKTFFCPNSACCSDASKGESWRYTSVADSSTNFQLTLLTLWKASTICSGSSESTEVSPSSCVGAGDGTYETTAFTDTPTDVALYGYISLIAPFLGMVRTYVWPHLRARLKV